MAGRKAGEEWAYRECKVHRREARERRDEAPENEHPQPRAEARAKEGEVGLGAQRVYG